MVVSFPFLVQVWGGLGLIFLYHSRPPHWEHPRQVQKGQLIHESVLDGIPTGYEPKARIYDDEIAWDILVWDKAVLENRKMIEIDPYAQVGEVLSRLHQHDWAKSEFPDADVDVLTTLASTGEFFYIWCAKL